MSVEHVYYRSTRPARETAPGRILWYVSGGEQGGMRVVACSQLTATVDGPAEEAWRRFRRLGIYSRSDVLATADRQGNVRALQVADTVLLPSPVPYGRLLKLGARHGQTLLLVSPVQISAPLFAAIMEDGHG